MKIAFFSKHLPSDEPNGVSVQVHRLAEGLAGKGHSVTVFTFSPPVEGAVYRCVTLPQHRRSRSVGKFIPAFVFRKTDTAGFDIVHYHGDDYFCRGSKRRIRTFYGSALMEAVHARSFGRFCYQALFYVFEWISCLRKGHTVAISADTSRYLPPVREHIPCCVPLDRYCPEGAKSTHPSILFLGDFTSRKRGLLMVQAFSSEVLPVFPLCILTVVGPVPCGGPGIRYAGRCGEDELIRLYRESWVFCMPSSYEGFGVPVVEAMACGTAVVATVNAGSSTLIRGGVDGLLCTPELLGSTLVKMLGDDGLRGRLAQEGVRTAGQYGSTTVTGRYEQLYHRAVGACAEVRVNEEGVQKSR